MYQYELGSAFFAKSAVEVRLRGLSLLEELDTFADASRNALRSSHCPYTFMKTFFG